MSFYGDCMEECYRLRAENARLRDALAEAVTTVSAGQLRSIGSLHNTRVAQVPVAALGRWRAALEGGDK